MSYWITYLVLLEWLETETTEGSCREFSSKDLRSGLEKYTPGTSDWEGVVRQKPKKMVYLQPQTTKWVKGMLRMEEKGCVRAEGDCRLF